MTEAGPTRCGFVAVLGAPNVGKSTLVNYLVGAKVSIVSPKVQTTRSRIRGICVQDDTQIIFIDTPGIFSPRRRLDRAMVSTAWQGAADADIVTLLVDCSRKIDDETQQIINELKKREQRVIGILNKIDLVEKSRLLELATSLEQSGVFSDIFMISSTNGDGVPDLLKTISDRVPEGPWHYPEDEIADTPLKLWAAEITREQLYLQLQQELPYATAVETEKLNEKPDGSIEINQLIYVERPGQKGIILGSKGQKIKSIGATARRELEKLLDRRVHLMLFVKVRKNWGEDPDHYRPWGLDFEA